MLYTVYHIALDSDKVNAEGWDAAPHYLKMTSPATEKAVAYTNELIGETQAYLSDKLERVAVIEATGLNEVYHRTNHIDSAWHEAGVDSLEVISKDPRSTSVGDIIVDQTGKAFRVSNFGFTELADRHYLMFSQPAGESV